MNPPELYLACTIRGVVVDGSPVFDVLDEQLRATDAGHRPFGVTSVETRWDRIRVHHTPVSAIASAPAQSDETLGLAQISAHASAGLTYLDVFLRRNGVLVKPIDACLPYSNVWLLAYGWPGLLSRLYSPPAAE